MLITPPSIFLNFPVTLATFFDVNFPTTLKAFPVPLNKNTSAPIFAIASLGLIKASFPNSFPLFFKLDGIFFN